MFASAIFCFVIYLICALIMIGIGVSNLKSKKPVTINTGEKPFRSEELSDVPMWNKKHGFMWISYGIIIMLSYVLCLFVGVDSNLGIFFLAAGVVVPIPVMEWYHHKLIRLYKIVK